MSLICKTQLPAPAQTGPSGKACKPFGLCARRRVTRLSACCVARGAGQRHARMHRFGQRLVPHSTATDAARFLYRISAGRLTHAGAGIPTALQQAAHTPARTGTQRHGRALDA